MGGSVASTDEGSPDPKDGWPRTLAPEISVRIKIARVICILAVVYVHLPPYGDAVPASPFSLEGLVWFVREGVGRSSVPLLSVMSGYLTAMNSGGRSWSDRLRRKVATLLVPLALWNALSLLKGFIASGGHDFPGLADLPQALFGVTGYPNITPLYFLRDIFVCSLLAPLTLAAVTRLPKLTLLVLAANAVFNFDGVVLINGGILLFFALGMAIATGRLQVQPSPGERPWVIAGAALVMLLIASMPFYRHEAFLWESGNPWREAHVVALRCAAGILFWSATVWISRRALAPRLVAIEPVIFFVFCGHTLMISAIWAVLRRLGVTVGDPAHVAFFLLGPVAVLFASLGAITVLLLTAPRFLDLLMGGRLLTFGQLWTILRRHPRPGGDGRPRELRPEEL